MLTHIPDGLQPNRAAHNLRTAITCALLFMLFFTFGDATAQTAQTPISEEHIRQVIQTLKPGNRLRHALERGSRGDGIHYAWMDTMRHFGVKEVSVEIRFRWENGNQDLKITSMKYLLQYSVYDSFASPGTVEQIHASGLEDVLKSEILSRARITIIDHEHDLGVNELCGTLYDTLVDDEALPILSVPDDVENCSLASTRPQDVNLIGIPGPYSFGRVCRLATDELWMVGGSGTVKYINRFETVEKQITDEDLSGVYFTSSDVGWVVGNQGSIWHTTNRGKNWSQQTTGVKQSLKGIKCASDSRCWAVGENGIVLRTDDGGQRWEDKRSEASADLYAVDFVDEVTGWAVGEDGLLLHTDNGGDSWETQQAKITLFPKGPFAKPTDLVTVKFLDRNVGWVAGSGGIARTENGGKTWETKEIEDTYFIGLVARDLKTVWAIGSEGINYVTKDGGRTWEPAMEKILVKRQPKKVTQLSSMAIRRRRVH